MAKAFCCSRKCILNLPKYKQTEINWGKLFFFKIIILYEFHLVTHFFTISFDFFLSTLWGTKVQTTCTGSYAPDKRDRGLGLNFGLLRTNQGSGEGDVWTQGLQITIYLFQCFNCLATLPYNSHEFAYKYCLSVTVGIIHGFERIMYFFYHVPTFSINQQHNFFTQSFGRFAGG